MGGTNHQTWVVYYCYTNIIKYMICLTVFLCHPSRTRILPFPSSARQGCRSINSCINATPKLHLLKLMLCALNKTLVNEEFAFHSKKTLFTVYQFVTMCPSWSSLYYHLSSALNSWEWPYCWVSMALRGSRRLTCRPLRRDETDRDPCEPVKLSSTGARNKKTMQSP